MKYFLSVVMHSDIRYRVFSHHFFLKFTPCTLKCRHHWIHILEIICLLSFDPFSCAKYYREL